MLIAGTFVNKGGAYIVPHLTIVLAAINLGFAAGIVVGGFLVDMDWRLLFWGDGLSTLVYGRHPVVPDSGRSGGGVTSRAR